MSAEQIEVELLSCWGTDTSVAHQAWASSYDFEKLEKKTLDDVRRVVTGVVTNVHQTPKERLFFEFFITCPIFVERQLDKYRMSVQHQDFRTEFETGVLGRWGITQNELSGRYRTIPDRPYKMPLDVASIIHRAAEPGDSTSRLHVAQIQRQYNEHIARQHESYQTALDYLRAGEKAGRITNAEYKRAREVLRGELGTCYLTDMRWVMNLGCLEHVVNQRLAPEAQMESRVVALKMLDAVEKSNVAPAALAAMVEKNGWGPWRREVSAWWLQEISDVQDL